MLWLCFVSGLGFRPPPPPQKNDKNTHLFLFCVTLKLPSPSPELALEKLSPSSSSFIELLARLLDLCVLIVGGGWVGGVGGGGFMS